ncbi:NinE family protein, partial [Salmonella enterica subsp. houtenae]|nr:NinE family protein [Salmonella enterica subsp. houtenae]
IQPESKFNIQRIKKPIPTESQVKTFDYVYGLLQSKWNRMRRTR